MLSRSIGLTVEFVKYNLKEFMAERGNFWIYFVTIFLYQALYIIFISVVFTQAPTIKGWGFYEVLFIYGFFNTASGFFYLIFSWTLWFSESYIIDRRLDVILTFPIDPYFCILLQELGTSIMEVISIVLGVIIVIFSAVHLGVQVSLFHILQFLTAVLGAVLILGGLFSFVTAIAFWVKSRAPLVTPLMHVIQFAQYPISIYAKWLRVILTFVIPVGFVGFYPAASILGRYEWYFYPLTLLLGMLVFCGGYVVWNVGLGRYESAGS